MSKHTNYSQYSKQNHQETQVDETAIYPEAEVEETNVVIETAESEIVVAEETVETEPETVVGIVTNCSKLNVRATPDTTAEVVCIIDVNSEVEIDVAKSTYDWVSVCTTSGVEGYCMRKYIDADL